MAFRGQGIPRPSSIFATDEWKSALSFKANDEFTMSDIVDHLTLDLGFQSTI